MTPPAHEISCVPPASATATVSWPGATTRPYARRAARPTRSRRQTTRSGSRGGWPIPARGSSSSSTAARRRARSGWTASRAPAARSTSRSPPTRAAAGSRRRHCASRRSAEPARSSSRSSRRTSARATRRRCEPSRERASRRSGATPAGSCSSGRRPGEGPGYPRPPMADPILSGGPVAEPPDDARWRRGFDAHLRAETQTREYRAIVASIAADRPAAVLDWGCGFGQVSHLLKQAGLDVHSFEYRGPDAPDAEVPLRLYPDIRAYVSSDPVALPYPDASFDAVLSCGVLEHTGSQEANLDEVARVLKPGGRFHVYKLPNRFSYLEWIARRLGLHYHGSDPGDMLFTIRQTRDDVRPPRLRGGDDPAGEHAAADARRGAAGRAAVVGAEPRAGSRAGPQPPGHEHRARRAPGGPAADPRRPQPRLPHSRRDRRHGDGGARRHPAPRRPARPARDGARQPRGGGDVRRGGRARRAGRRHEPHRVGARRAAARPADGRPCRVRRRALARVARLPSGAGSGA